METHLSWIYNLLSLFCHQAKERTWSLGGLPLPLCARCTGLYAGFLLGLISQAINGYSRTQLLPDKATLLLVIGAAAVMSGEGLASSLNLVYHSHLFRFCLGIAAGSGISFLLLPAVNYSLGMYRKISQNSRQLTWRRWPKIIFPLIISCFFHPGKGRMFFFGWQPV
ncbi:MAG: DUF2085 domain-containing protein [Candidatus Omnitrophica bacterium]|nr:DUF2085 domain-containing protein [Candidatus Omnitrophota bacterium]